MTAAEMVRIERLGEGPGVQADSDTPAPPHSLEAEACVLGSIMLDAGEVWPLVAGVVSEADFWSPAHREIFQACQNLDRRSAPIDLMTVAEELRASGKLEAIGGTEYLARLVELTPSPANAPHYARVVADYARLRRLLHATHEIQKLCYEPGDDLTTALEQAERINTEFWNRNADVRSAARKLSEVAPEAVDWIIDGLIPRGCISLLAGRPGEGKSTLALMWAAEVTRAGGKVLLVSAEDDPARVLRPRAEAAGADLERVAFLDLMRASPQLPDDTACIEREVRAMGADLVVIDPLNAFLHGTVDSHRDASMRGALRPLHELAERTNAGLLVVCHFNKTGKGDALSRIGGSVAYTAAARSVIVTVSREDGQGGRRRYVGLAKSNYAAIRPPVEYLIDAVELPSGILTTRVRFLDEVPEVSINDLLMADEDHHPSRVEEVAEELEGILSGGPVPADEAQAMLKARLGPLSKPTIQAAKRALGVRSRRQGFDAAGWVWELQRTSESAKPQVNSKGFLPAGPKPAKPHVNSKGFLSCIKGTEETLRCDLGKRDREPESEETLRSDLGKRTESGQIATESADGPCPECGAQQAKRGYRGHAMECPLRLPVCADCGRHFDGIPGAACCPACTMARRIRGEVVGA